MVKFKKIGVLAVSAIMAVSSVLNVYAKAGKGEGYIYRNGSKVGRWENEMSKQYACASTCETNTGTGTQYYKNTYMTVNVQSIYPYGGSHAYYVNATLNVNETGNHGKYAYADKSIPTTEYGTSAYTKHVIIIEGTSYTPEYPNGISNVVRPD